MIKSFKMFLESNQDIDSICEKFNITNYTINTDGSIDVDGDVVITYKRLSKLPLKFGNVSGGFYCYSNQLTSLEGGPQNVGGYFSCSYNQLTSLEGCPKNVSGNFDCSNNQLTSLEGCSKNVSGNFDCSNNQLTSLKGSPQSVAGGFYCSYNQLTSLEGFPKNIGGDFYCRNNQLVDFIGFPEFWEGGVNFIGNPVQSIIDQFPKELQSKAIYWINEYDVIQNGKVIEDRLEEVKYQFGI
jgi:hypothetical protein